MLGKLRLLFRDRKRATRIVCGALPLVIGLYQVDSWTDCFKMSVRYGISVVYINQLILPILSRIRFLYASFKRCKFLHASAVTDFSWVKFFAKQIQDLVYLIHPNRGLTIFQFPDEPITHTGSFRQLLLGQVVQLTLITNVFIQSHIHSDYPYRVQLALKQH